MKHVLSPARYEHINPYGTYTFNEEPSAPGPMLEDHDGPAGDWALYQDLVHDDMDCNMLYDPALGGIEDLDDVIAQRIGMVNLHLAGWFSCLTLRTRFTPTSPTSDVPGPC